MHSRLHKCLHVTVRNSLRIRYDVSYRDCLDGRATFDPDASVHADCGLVRHQVTEPFQQRTVRSEYPAKQSARNVNKDVKIKGAK